MAFSKTQFEAFVDSLGLNYFSAKELLVGRYQADNGPPPVTIWHNIVPTILIIDHLREYTGCGIKLISAYRTEAYNDPAKNPGRAPLSQHQAFTAIDFRVTGMKPDKVVPILQERGRFRSEYTGATLREHYGLPRPANPRRREAVEAAVKGVLSHAR